MSQGENRPSSAEQLRINEQLLHRVARAREAFANAKTTCAELKAISEHLGTLHPDSTQASLGALRIERQARQEYTDAIMALTQFTLDQKLPVAPVELHLPSIGHFRCRCGEHLAFGTEGTTVTLLVNQKKEGTRKVGECPACGCVHQTRLAER